MTNNTTVTPSYAFLGLCNFDGVAREHNSAFDEVNLSISIIIALMSPVAVTGNALILITIWKNPSLRRTASSVLLCGLALSDLCTGFMSQPFFVATELICLEKPQEIKDHISFLVFAKVIAEGCGTYFVALTVVVMTFMSIERWLHITRQSLLTARRACFTMTGLLLLPIPIAILRSLHVLKGTHELVLNVITFIVLLFCLLATSVAYFKVFRIIRRHQQQVQPSETSQNFGQPAINLAKYKKSVFSILYIVLLFYISYLPFLVFLSLYNSFQNHFEVELAFLITNIFLFLSCSLNPLIYLCMMSDIRNGVKKLLKQLICKDN